MKGDLEPQASLSSKGSQELHSSSFQGSNQDQRSRARESHPTPPQTPPQRDHSAGSQLPLLLSLLTKKKPHDDAPTARHQACPSVRGHTSMAKTVTLGEVTCGHITPQMQIALLAFRQKGIKESPSYRHGKVPSIRSQTLFVQPRVPPEINSDL